MAGSDTRRFEDGLCYGCRKRYRSRVGTFVEESRCRSCSAPLCTVCWQSKRTLCAEHAETSAGLPAGVEPTAVTSVATMPAAPATPPSDALFRAAAREREENFLARVERSTLEQPAFYHPGEGRAYPQGERTIERHELGAEEVRRHLRAPTVAHPRDVFAEMPLNRALVHPVAARTLLGRRTVHVSVVGACVSPLADLVEPGWSRRAMEWRDAAAAVDKLAADPAVFHYCALFAPTGWSEEARRHQADRSNALVTLVELHGARWTVQRTTDPRWGHADGLFRLNSDEECRELLAGFVRERSFELLMGWLTDRFAAQELGLDLESVRRGFEAVCRADPFVRGEISGDGYRLTRVY